MFEVWTGRMPRPPRRRPAVAPPRDLPGNASRRPRRTSPTSAAGRDGIPEARRLLNQAGDLPLGASGRGGDDARPRRRGRRRPRWRTAPPDASAVGPAHARRRSRGAGDGCRANGDLELARSAATELRAIAESSSADELAASAAFVDGVIAFDDRRSGRGPAGCSRARCADRSPPATSTQTARARLWLSRTLLAKGESRRRRAGGALGRQAVRLGRRAPRRP